jgi:DNA adenine methylase
MKYLGGKHTLARRIADYLESVRPDGSTFFDVFAGGLNVVAAMSGERVANDACEPLIALYRALQDGWDPPQELDEDEYHWIHAANDSADPLTAFAGFGCAYAGKYFGGYARDPAKGRNFAAVAARGLERKIDACLDVQFECLDFADLDIPSGSLVYLDPPYRGTTAYGYFSEFDHKRFDRWALALARRCVVVMSEYSAPRPWVEVASFDVRKSNFKGCQTERLFQCAQ